MEKSRISWFTLSNYTGYKNVTHDNMEKSRISWFTPSNLTGYKNVTRNNKVCNLFLSME